MNREDRAKQFLPFDALNGLTAELKRRAEKVYRVEKRTPSEEKLKEISELFLRIEKGSKIRVVFYCDGKYLSLEGVVKERNVIYKYLKIEDGKIFFEDIYDVEIIE